jgi:hypothetical protein
LVRAVEIASSKKVKSIHEIYETKPVWLVCQEAISVYKCWEINHEQFCCCQDHWS